MGASSDGSSFLPQYLASCQLRRRTHVFPFRQRRLLVRHGREGFEILSWGELREIRGSSLSPIRHQHLGSLEGRAVASLELGAEARAPEGTSFEGLRSLFGRLSDDLFWVAARAVQVVDFERDHQFCGHCGEATERAPDERAVRCKRCQKKFYPRLSPAVIVLVTRGEEMLLARSPHFPPGMYSTLAGFVEPGERLEETVVREVREEVGVELRGLRYFGSQPWPFPNSLMLAFLAEYGGGELQVDGVEIEDAKWFSPFALPRIPPRISIARAMIESHLETLR